MTEMIHPYLCTDLTREGTKRNNPYTHVYIYIYIYIYKYIYTYIFIFLVLLFVYIYMIYLVSPRVEMITDGVY